jgi:hypothetical protein
MNRSRIVLLSCFGMAAVCGLLLYTSPNIAVAWFIGVWALFFSAIGSLVGIDSHNNRRQADWIGRPEKRWSWSRLCFRFGRWHYNTNCFGETTGEWWVWED